MLKYFSLKTIVSTCCAIFFSAFLFSCNKDQFDLNKLTSGEWNPNLAVPIVNTSLDVYNLFAKEDSNEVVIIDPDTRMLALLYKGEVFSFDAQEIVKLPDGSKSQDLSLGASEINDLVVNGSVTRQFNSVYTYPAPQGIKISSAQLKAGFLDFNISSSFQHNGTIKINLPSFTKNGVPFEAVLPHDYTGTPVIISRTFDLTGYTIDMANGGSNYNQFPVSYTITLQNSGNPVTSADKMNITQAYRSFNYSIVYGDFGKQLVGRDKDSIFVRLFTNAMKGQFRLTNPRLLLTAVNTFGFPININFDSLYTHNLNSGVRSPITFSGFQNPFAIEYPSQPNVPRLTELVIDKTNSSIIDIVTPAPKYLIYKINAVSNPAGPPATPNFITDKSRFALKTELELPLDGYAYDFEFLDTAAYKFGASPDEVESVMLRLNFENGFPFDLKSQLYLADENFKILDSLLIAPKNFINSGMVDANGKVTQPVTTITDVVIDKMKIPNFMKTFYIITKAEVESYKGRKQNSVKIYEHYKLNVKVGMQIQSKMRL